jgi:choline dehydrogenase-like flavoprotein
MTTTTFSVRVGRSTKSRLEKLAKSTGRSRAFLAAEAISAYLDANHLAGTARMGDDPTTSVVNADCRSWDIPNLWVCDGLIFPTTGGVNPSLTITGIAMRTADRIRTMAVRGEL